MFMTVWTVRREKIIMKIIYQLTSVWPHNAQCSSHSGECWRRNAITSLQNARPASPCTLVAAVYLALLLSRIMADREGLANFRWSRSWVVCCQCCILRLHNYRATLLVRSSFACCWSPSTRLAHLTHLTRRLRAVSVGTFEHLTRRLCAITVGTLGHLTRRLRAVTVGTLGRTRPAHLTHLTPRLRAVTVGTLGHLTRRLRAVTVGTLGRTTPAHLTHLTRRLRAVIVGTLGHLTRRLCAVTVGVMGRGDVDNFCV